MTTQKGNRLFVHILNLKDDALYLPMEGKQVSSAKLFVDSKPVKFTKVAGGIVLQLGRIPDETVCVVEVELK